MSEQWRTHFNEFGTELYYELEKASKPSKVTLSQYEKWRNARLKIKKGLNAIGTHLVRA